MTIDQALHVGRRLRIEGKLADAEGVFRQIVAAHPAHAEAWNDLGVALATGGKLQAARDAFESATDANSEYDDAWMNLGRACEEMEDLPHAIAAFSRAAELRGDAGTRAAVAWQRVGVCLGKSRQYSKAEDALQKAMRLDPASISIHNDLALALGRGGQFDQAISLAKKTLEMEDNPKWMAALATTLRSAGRYEEAIEVCRRGIARQNDVALLHGELALCLLSRGELEEGWREYEWRWECDNFQKNQRRSVERQWGHPTLGVGHADVSGRTLLLYSEQGMGDTIQFVRYAKILAERGARVLVECQWQLKSLLQSCPGVTLVYGREEKVPKYDWHIPMMSLPLAMGTTVETIPSGVYLSANPRRAETWRERVCATGKAGMRVGLVWAGSTGHTQDEFRSIPPGFFDPLAAVAGVRFFSLQKNDEKRAATAPKLKLVDLTASLCDFADTAALVEQLDLVITADTAVAHLAGAMGKAVWTLLPFTGDWRWMTQRADTPWYSSMRLFRQKAHGDWAGVMEAVGRELAAASAERRDV